MAYKTPVVVELYYSGAWHDHTTGVATTPPITIARGRQDEAQQASPGVCTLTFLNADAKYSPRNPNSALYGLIGRNTPIRVSVTGYGTRFVGEVESWPQVWDASGRVAYVPVTAYGILRRLGAGGTNAPAKSVLRRWIPAQSPDAYWPMEDGPLSDELRPAIGGDTLTIGRLAAVVASGTGDMGPWLPKGIALPNFVVLRGRMAGTSVSPQQWTIDLVYRINADRADNTTVTLEGWQNETSNPSQSITLRFFGDNVAGNGGTWKIAYPDINTQIATTTIPSTAMKGNTLHHLRLNAVQSGSDIAVSTYLDGTLILTGTISSVSLIPLIRAGVWTVYLADFTGYNTTEQFTVGHLAAYHGAGPTLADAVDAMNGFPGESAADRLARLGDEDGIVTTLVGDADTPMGPQPIGTPMALRQECIDADGGILVEDRDGLTLTYTALDALYNQPVDVTLDYSGKEVSPPLQPVEDTRYIRNEVTVTRSGGGATTVTQDSGPLNVNEPSDDPQGVGLYTADYTLNLATDLQTLAQAGWLVHIGTAEDARYPSITANLTGLHEAGKTTLMADVAALDVAGRVEVTNPPAWQGLDSISQRVQGYTETIGSHMWTRTDNTSPARPYDVGTSSGASPASTDARCAGDAAAAIRADITSTATSIAFDPNLFRWASVLVRDTFTRSVSNDWGTPDIGSAWVAQTPSWYSVTGGKGKIVLSSADSDHLDSTTATYRDVDMWVTVTAPVTAAGASYTVSLVRVTDPGSWGNGYRLMAEWTTSGTVNLLLQSLAAGTLVTASAVTTYSPGDTFRLRFQIVGPKLAGKVWKTTVGEPDWQVAAVDTAETAGAVEIRVARNSGNTNANLTLLFDDLFVGSPGTSPGDFPMPVRLVHAPGIAGGGELVTVSSIATTEPTVVAAGAMSSADNTSVTPALYSGHTSGDWICVWAGKDGTGGTLTTPTGYTLLASQGKGYLWAKRHGSSESAPTITPSGGSSGDTVSAVTFGLRNMPTTLTPDEYVVDHAGQSNSSAQNVAYPGLTAGIQWGRVILLLARKSDDDTGIAPPSGFTELVDATTTAGNDQSLWVGYRIDTAPAGAAPGVLTVTGGAAAISDTVVVALAGGYQTATVTRSTNSVVKAHTAGTLIAVETPGVYAL